GARVTVASTALVVLERTVRDRSCPPIKEAPAAGDADAGLVVGTGRGVGAADGLVIRERAAAHKKASPSGIEDAATTRILDQHGGGAATAVAAVPGDRLVAGERTVDDGEVSVIKDGAAFGLTAAAVAEGLVLGEQAVADGEGGARHIDNGSALRVAAQVAERGIV